MRHLTDRKLAAHIYHIKNYLYEVYLIKGTVLLCVCVCVCVCVRACVRACVRECFERVFTDITISDSKLINPTGYSRGPLSPCFIVGCSSPVPHRSLPELSPRTIQTRVTSVGSFITPNVCEVDMY